MSYTIFRTLNKVPGKDEYFLTWTHNWGGGIHRIYNLIFDSDGNILVDWHIAYNYDNEEPEDLYHINGTMDEDGNLYLIYAQVETEPEIDYFPTFGWFDYNYVGTEQQEAAVPGQGLSFSCNPVTGSSLCIRAPDQTLFVCSTSLAERFLRFLFQMGSESGMERHSRERDCPQVSTISLIQQAIYSALRYLSSNVCWYP